MNTVELLNQNFDTAELRDVFVADAIGSPVQDKERMAVYNINKGKTASIVSRNYKITQHSAVITAVSEAINGLNINNSVRIIENGNRVFVDVEFTDAKIYVAEGEEFIAGLRIVNSYDKSTGIRVLPKLKRLICNNGMVISKGFVAEYTINHVNRLKEDFTTVVQRMLKDMISQNEKLKAMVNDCIGDSIEWELMDKIIAKNTWNSKKHKQAIIDRVKDLETVTRWDLYNAFTNHATHSDYIKPTVEATLQRNAQKILLTPLKVLAGSA